MICLQKPVSEAPEAIFSGEEDTSHMMKIVAVVGWTLFAICLIFIVLVFILLRRGRLNGLCLGRYHLLEFDKITCHDRRIINIKTKQ